MKPCSKCGEVKDESQFAKNKQQKSGLHPCCKTCRNAEYKARYPKDRERLLKKNAEWRANNHERQLELQRQHYYRNKPHYTAKVVERQAHVKRATPSWLTKKDRESIRREYDLAALLSEATGYSWHVDHIVPLRGHNVSGLHVPNNLRATPWFKNLEKGNTHLT